MFFFSVLLKISNLSNMSSIDPGFNIYCNTACTHINIGNYLLRSFIRLVEKNFQQPILSKRKIICRVEYMFYLIFWNLIYEFDELLIQILYLY